MPPQCQLLSGRVLTYRLSIRPAQSTQRTFASVTPAPPVKSPLQRRRGGDLGSHLPKYVIPQDAYIPPYPYGPRTLFKQANRGLYGGQMIQFGNNVSSETETKTRRHWKPNVLSKSLYSVALKKKIKLRVTAKVLKIMDREGGLDEYLLKDSETRIKELGPMGWALRWTVMQRPEVIARLRAEAAALGLDQATIDTQWPTVEIMAKEGITQLPLDQLEHEGFEETEDQELWDPAEGEASEESSQPIQLSKKETTVSRNAVTEYVKVIYAAARYVKRGVVDNESEGIKLAFLRAKEREEARRSLQKAFDDKVAQMFSAQDIEAVRAKLNLPHYLSDRAARRIAYNQWKRAQIEAAGSVEAWKAANYGEEAAAHEARIAEAGGIEARKAKYKEVILEAESAEYNQANDPTKKEFLETAMAKANMAIRAKAVGGEQEYANALVLHLRAEKAQRRRSSRSAEQKNSGDDAWAALVASGSSSAESQLRV